MNGWTKTLSNIINHERYQTIAMLFIVGLLFWFYGCESKVSSPRDPSLKLTRGELISEFDFLAATYKVRFDQLDRHDAFKRILTEQAMLATETGTINPMGVVAALIGAFGIGATVDNVRKRKEIKTLSNNATPKTP